jgi:hypothetical protein
VWRVTIPAVVLVTSLALVPVSAQAQTPTSYHVRGVEVYATATEGVFVGVASPDRGAGTWYADVIHKGLARNGEITGGSFGMLLTSSPRTITGKFDGGQVTLKSGGECNDEVYDVSGSLNPVSAGKRTTTGDFDVTLTHHRRWVFSRCVTYAATVVGSATFLL